MPPHTENFFVVILIDLIYSTKFSHLFNFCDVVTHELISAKMKNSRMKRREGSCLMLPAERTENVQKAGVSIEMGKTFPKEFTSVSGGARSNRTLHINTKCQAKQKFK